MNLSLNEVEATAKRAARGAGYGWGISEEAAKATRWLCARGIDGTAELLGVLEQGFTAAQQDHVPQMIQGDWQGAGPLCPLSTGALLSDCATLMREGVFSLQSVAHPSLLLPFMGYAARRLDSVVSIEGDGWKAATDGQQLCAPDHLPDHAAQLRVRLGGTMGAPRKSSSRMIPDAGIWERLNQYAHRTYAPATEESRLLGAGAGLSDND